MSANRSFPVLHKIFKNYPVLTVASLCGYHTSLALPVKPWKPAQATNVEWLEYSVMSNRSKTENHLGAVRLICVKLMVIARFIISTIFKWLEKGSKQYFPPISLRGKKTFIICTTYRPQYKVRSVLPESSSPFIAATFTSHDESFCINWNSWFWIWERKKKQLSNCKTLPLPRTFSYSSSFIYYVPLHLVVQWGMMSLVASPSHLWAWERQQLNRPACVQHQIHHLGSTRNWAAAWLSLSSADQ